MFEFAWPWVFLLLPLPWLIHRLVKPARTTAQQPALKVPFYRAILQFSARDFRGSYVQHWKRWLLYSIWSLLVMAASGPEWLGPPIARPHEGRNIMMVVDISGSMELPDMTLHGKQVDRLTAVKDVAAQFIQQRVGDRLGLILFGSRAYLQTPLTFDRATVQAMLQDATIGLAGPQTALGDAIGLSLKRLLNLSKQKGEHSMIVLLTDGVNNTGYFAPIDAAKIAAQMGIRIYTIGFGAEQLAVPGLFGQRVMNPSSDLDEKTLQQIATLSQGIYFRAKDTASLAKAYQSIDRIEPISTEQATFRSVTPLYPWPLGAALFLVFLYLIPKIRRQSYAVR